MTTDCALIEDNTNHKIDEEPRFELQGITTLFPDAATTEERFVGIEVVPPTPGTRSNTIVNACYTLRYMIQVTVTISTYVCLIVEMVRNIGIWSK